MNENEPALCRDQLLGQHETRTIIDRFEEALFAGKSPRIEHAVPADHPQWLVLVEELIHAELEYHGKRYENVSLTEYLARFPEIDADCAAVARLWKTWARFAPVVEVQEFPLAIDPGDHALDSTIPLSPSTNEQLLFGMLALRGEFITREQLVTAFDCWIQSGSQTLPEIMLTNRALTPEQRYVVDRHVVKFLMRHGGNVEQSLTALRAATDPKFVAFEDAGHEEPLLPTTGAESQMPREARNETPISFAHLDDSTTSRNGPNPEDPQHAEAGEAYPKIPGFEIHRELGRGGMGIVYRSLQKSTGRLMALKVMKPNLPSGLDHMKAFVREASVLSQLNHPSILRFCGMGTTEDGFYLVTELVETVELAELLEGQSLPYRIKIICGIACQVLEALEYAHNAGLVHRDIKPNNILLSRASGKLKAKLADFGLAKSFEDAGFSDMTDDGDLRGSPAYLAPEQIVNARYAKPHSDLYSLGVSIYQMISGRLPFEVPNRSGILKAILEDPPVPLDRHCPDIPTELLFQLNRALAKQPHDRFTSASEMHAALLPFRQRTKS